MERMDPSRGRDLRRPPSATMRRARSVAAAAVVAAACGSSITSPPEQSSLLDSSQPRSLDSTVSISSAGVFPQVLHVNAPVTVTFKNADGAAHRVEAAPELGYGNCTELAQFATLGPGESGTVTLSRTGVICGYRDSAGPTNFAFQGLIVLH